MNAKILRLKLAGGGQADEDSAKYGDDIERETFRLYEQVSDCGFHLMWDFCWDLR